LYFYFTCFVIGTRVNGVSPQDTIPLFPFLQPITTLLSKDGALPAENINPPEKLWDAHWIGRALDWSRIGLVAHWIGRALDWSRIGLISRQATFSNLKHAETRAVMENRQT